MTEKNFVDVASILLCETNKLNQPYDIQVLLSNLRKVKSQLDSAIYELERLHIRSLEQDEYFKVMACDEMFDDNDIGNAEDFVQKKVGDF